MAPTKYKLMTSCLGRDVTPLQEYAKENGLSPKTLLAEALEKDKMLQYFKRVPKVNECEFSFPKTNWFGVFIEDEEGRFFINHEGDDVPGVYYFQIEITTNGPKIVNGTFEMPAELNGVRPCVINEKGKCGVPPPEKVSKSKSKEPAVSQQIQELPKLFKGLDINLVNVGASSSSSVPEESEIQIGSPDRGTAKQQHDRSFFEKMDTKQIVDWMINNMKLKDILGCLQSASLSPQQQEALRQVEASGLASFGTYKRIKNARDKMVKRLKSSKSKMASKLKSAKSKTGSKLKSAKSKAGSKLKATKSKVGSKLKATKSKVSSKLRSAKSKAASKLRSAKTRVSKLVKRKPVSKRSTSCGCAGTKPPEMAFGRKASMAQKRVRTAFKMAAKKCKMMKGKYTVCMKRELKKRKTKKTTKRKTTKRTTKRRTVKPRKSTRTVYILGFGKKRKLVKRVKKVKKVKKLSPPKISPRVFRIGTVRKGRDGRRWVVKKSKLGVKKWVKK